MAGARRPEQRAEQARVAAISATRVRATSDAAAASSAIVSISTGYYGGNTLQTAIADLNDRLDVLEP